MKKLAALLISVVLLLVSGCGKQDSDADQLRAEDLPESCRGWFDIAETAGAAEENSGFPAAARAAEGAAEGGIAARLPDGTEVDVVGESEPLAEGVKLSELTDGKAKRLGSGGRVIWNGELYDACTIAAENCRLPNLRPHEGGILRLDISGDCTVDGGGEEFGCFAGFDCVVVTGSGTLTIQTAAYKGTSAITSGATYVWKKYVSGAWQTISGQTGSSLSVEGSTVDGVASFQCVMTYGGKTYTDTISLTDKTDNYQASIESSGGDVFKNSVGSSTLLCRLFQNGQEVDTDGSAHTYKWYRRDKDGNAMDSGGVFATGKSIAIDGDDVDVKTTFICEVT